MVEPEQIEKLRTLLRAMTPKANDPEGLAQLETLSDEWEAMIAEQARALNDQGYSWEAISKPLKINRSAAWQRYARPKGEWRQNLAGDPYGAHWAATS